jgi:hypothetical protein
VTELDGRRASRIRLSEANGSPEEATGSPEEGASVGDSPA